TGGVIEHRIIAHGHRAGDGVGRFTDVGVIAPRLGGDGVAGEIERALGAAASDDEPVVHGEGGGVLDVDGCLVAAAIGDPELAGGGDEVGVAPERHQVVFAALADRHVAAAGLVEG